MVRPFWSGQFRVSLVSFGIQLFPATDAKGEIHFHQLNQVVESNVIQFAAGEPRIHEGT